MAPCAACQLATCRVIAMRKVFQIVIMLEARDERRLTTLQQRYQVPSPYFRLAETSAKAAGRTAR